MLRRVWIDTEGVLRSACMAYTHTHTHRHRHTIITPYLLTNLDNAACVCECLNGHVCTLVPVHVKWAATIHMYVCV